MLSTANQPAATTAHTASNGAVAPKPEPAHLHWAESGMEAALLGLFMVSACSFTVLFELPSSPFHQAIPDAMVRRAVIGVAMGLTAIALIYSPWGQRSGANMNPAVTLTFYRLGKIRRPDAALYILGQFLGGVGGVMVAGLVLRNSLSRPEVLFAATHPGSAGPWVALAAEFLISFVMMSMVLRVSNRPALMRYTGLFAGLLVAIYITFEAPYSGMSMNPARSFASALPASVWTDFWIYLIAPPLGMLAAAEVYLLAGTSAEVKCCKLYHNPNQRCTFCGMNGDRNE